MKLKYPVIYYARRAGRETKLIGFRKSIDWKSVPLGAARTAKVAQVGGATYLIKCRYW